MGLRAEESSARSKLNTLTKNARNSRGGRTWFDWLPIHTLSTAAVFAEIAGHPAPALGLSSGYDAAVLRLLHYGHRGRSADGCPASAASDRRYVSLELGLDYTMSMSKKTLPEITGIQTQEGATAHEMP